ncbi:DivIVA domain-containing protein [Kribbella sp. NPDC056861]|uniref:DivIVA domain-containing protein n=1 Tax=Kribbella sp. NPDC056861 TaxID=3154857 RepID=UPI00343D6DCE
MWFFGLIVVLLIGAVAVVASGRWGAMAPAYDDRPDLTVPARQALTAADLETARFGVGLRGYRMDEVDTLLERVGREVAERDRRIADLERAVGPIIHGPEGAGFTARADFQAADFDDTGYNQPILVGGDFPAQEAEASKVAEVAEPVVETTAEAPAAPESAPAPETTPAPAALPAPEAAPAPEALPAPEASAAPREAAALEEASEVEEAEEVEADDWFDEPVPAAPVDDRPQGPVPLPPMLQELVHTHTEDEPEAAPWFEAKEPPPDHTGTFQAITPDTDLDDLDADTSRDDTSREDAARDDAARDDALGGAGADDAEALDSDGQPRGRHSAAPDVSSVQRPT